MLQVEHSAILSTFIKLPAVIKAFILSTFEWPFYTGFNVFADNHLSTSTKIPVVTKVVVLSVFEWPFYTGFNVFADNPLLTSTVKLE